VDPDTLVRQVTGRTVDRDRDQELSDRTVAEVFDRLAGTGGLTAQASTFARQDVIAALGGQLSGATRRQLEELADRFLTELAVAVVAERALEERRWSTPELLAVEQQLVAAAVGRAGEQTAVVSLQTVQACHTRPSLPSGDGRTSHRRLRASRGTGDRAIIPPIVEKLDGLRLVRNPVIC
jgi:hypothetical protein